ncbi:MAG: glycosyltransferase involved in cell wall biosynthesis [Pseudohongiellaceae bacterium]
MAQPPASRQVALVIPTFNGGPRWLNVLAAWGQQDGWDEIALYCPDSGSSDGTPDAARAAGASVQAIDQRTFSHGGTRNDAVAATHSEFVILSVQDALPLTTTLARDLVAPLLADPGLSASYGRQQPLPGCHPVLTSRIGEWAGGEEPQVQQLGELAWEQLEPMERLGLIRYDHVIACVRRSAWERQPFAPVSFGEDVDWAARVIRDGGRIAFVPDATVEHSHNRPAWDEARRIYCDHRNLKRLVGLTTVPRMADLRVNIPAAKAHYRGLIAAATGADAATLQAWTQWSDKLATLENWAQYLGANFARRLWFRPVDRWLRRGI